MSQDAGFFGKLIVLGGSAVAMIGRCATAGDDIIRIGARSFDDVAMVSDDALRYSDDVFRSSDDLFRSADDVLLGTGKSVTEETMMYFDDIFLDIATEGAERFLEEDEEELEVPEENLLSDFRLDNLQNMRFGLSQKKYVFNESTKSSFLQILAYSTPIEKPKDAESGRLMILRGNQIHWTLLGNDWIGIRRLDQNEYSYYTLRVNFIEAFQNE